MMIMWGPYLRNGARIHIAIGTPCPHRSFMETPEGQQAKMEVEARKQKDSVSLLRSARP